MAVPHFEAEYDEPLQEHMAAEFTPDVATAVFTGQQLSRPLKQALISEAVSAARQRERFLKVLTTEDESLARAHTHLKHVDTQLEKTRGDTLSTSTRKELSDLDHQLSEEIAQCERRLETRQRDIHPMDRALTRLAEPLIQEHLYQSLDVSFPILSATLQRLRRCRTRCRAIRQELTHRHQVGQGVHHRATWELRGATERPKQAGAKWIGRVCAYAKSRVGGSSFHGVHVGLGRPPRLVELSTKCWKPRPGLPVGFTSNISFRSYYGAKGRHGFTGHDGRVERDRYPTLVGKWGHFRLLTLTTAMANLESGPNSPNRAVPYK